MTHTKTKKHLIPLNDFPYLLVNKLGEVFDTEKGIYLDSLYIDNNGYRILKNKRPKFFLAENVSGMLAKRHSEAKRGLC